MREQPRGGPAEGTESGPGMGTVWLGCGRGRYQSHIR